MRGDAEAFNNCLVLARRLAQTSRDRLRQLASLGSYPYGLGAFRPASYFGIMKRVMLKHTQAYKLGVNVMFYAFNQYYHRHYEE